MTLHWTVPLALAASVSSSQPAPKPDFSGTWVLNLQRSKIEIANPPAASTFTIRHKEPAFHLERTHTYSSGRTNTWSIDLVTDGKHEVTATEGSTSSRTRMYWEGDALVLDMTITTADGESGTNVVHYTLSPDGKTFTALERQEFPWAKHTNRWVFDRADTR
jgi:hypothetical protein